MFPPIPKLRIISYYEKPLSKQFVFEIKITKPSRIYWILLNRHSRGEGSLTKRKPTLFSIDEWDCFEQLQDNISRTNNC